MLGPMCVCSVPAVKKDVWHTAFDEVRIHLARSRGMSRSHFTAKPTFLALPELIALSGGVRLRFFDAY